jgi:hypothetical protein
MRQAVSGAAAQFAGLLSPELLVRPGVDGGTTALGGIARVAIDAATSDSRV